MSDVRIAPNLLPALQEHARRYLETNGAEGHMFLAPGHPEPVPTLLLTTAGRKSGERYLTPLIYGKVQDAYVIVASKRGATVNPGWYLNLLVHPEVDVQVQGDKFRARARTAAGSERATLWQHMAGIFPPYDEYVKTAGGREIPVVVLERIGR